MKSFRDLKLDVNEAAPQKKPIDSTAQKVNLAASALQLRRQGINPASVTSAQRRLNSLADKNGLSPSQQYQKLPTSLRNSYIQFGNEIPSGLLDQGVPMNAFRSVVQRLRSTKQQISKMQAAAEIEAQKAQQVAAAKQQQQQREEVEVFSEDKQTFGAPAMLVLRRIGTRNFPDGRNVAMYVNKDLGLVFSIPYVGKGQTPGEIIPGIQVTHATNEEMQLHEGSLKYHLDQAELHDKNDNDRLRDYHMNMAQHRVRGMRTPVEPNKKQQTAYENTLEQGRRFKQLRSQFNKDSNELNIDDPTLQDLHSKLNPKNKKILLDLAKTNPRKAFEIADKLTAATSTEQDQNTNTDK